MSGSTQSDEPRGRRISVDLTATAAHEVDRLRAITELSTADIFRHALTIFRLYVNAKQKGQQLIIADPKNQQNTLVELPVLVRGQPNTE